ncbi:MAG: Beta-galactosidase [Firmicutes bacterium]|nr:Beta-galactosidase [Bacillota bacterium]
MREVLNFNTDWLFKAGDMKGGEARDLDVRDFSEVHLPHTTIELPHHYFSETAYQFVSWYRRSFVAEESWWGKRVWVDFGAAMSVAEVYINGHCLGENKGGYVPFSFDLTEYVSFNSENVLAVRLDSTRRNDIPPEGNIVDYMLFGGIYRDVRLRLVHPVHLEKTRITTPRAEVNLARVDLITSVRNQTQVPVAVNVATEIFYDGQSVAALSSELITAAAGEVAAISIRQVELETPKLWDIDNPNLYKAVLTLVIDGQTVDRMEQVFGIRSIAFNVAGQFCLNEKPLKLRGLNRHQMFPYVGQAMGSRMQRKDAEILKYDLGLNYVRASHYPQDPSFLDRCDELGILVLEELPGWQFIGDENWKEIAIEHLTKMIERDVNHPSIFVWGVRINESQDDHDFYIKTNALAKKLDPTRPTIGTRFLEQSEFLEDVYGFNDFRHNVAGKLSLPRYKPSIITEYMGHMFPTRRFDHDARLMQHAENHASIQNISYGLPELAGASGWCAFDYNTHYNFGSGDHICYHGVMDIFRIPKYAAYFYQSQRDVRDGITLFIARRVVASIYEDGGDNITVYSNCQQVELFINDERIGRQNPDRVQFPNLPHPPFLFHKGSQWPNGYGPYDRNSKVRAVGYIDGKPVVEQVLFFEGEPDRLHLAADHNELTADGADMTRILIQAVDEHNQPLSLANGIVTLTIQGAGQLVGGNPLVLEAGQLAVYVRTSRTAGDIFIQAHSKFCRSGAVSLKSQPLREKIVPHGI